MKSVRKVKIEVAKKNTSSDALLTKANDILQSVKASSKALRKKMKMISRRSAQKADHMMKIIAQSCMDSDSD